MASTVTPAQMNGLFKEVYPNGIKTLYPEIAIILKAMGELSESERVGNKYHFPVVLTREQGVTYGGSVGDAYALNESIAGTTADAQLEGNEMTVRSKLSMRVASKSVGSAKAFKSAVALAYKSNNTTHAKRRELEFLYGRSATGLGQVAQNGISGSGTTRVVTITAATWAIGIWAAEENAEFNFYANADGALVSSGADAVFTLSSVDPDNRQLTFTGTSDGCAALATAIAAGACNVVFRGSRGATFTDYVEGEGIDYALTRPAGETLWNISTNYALWRANQHAAGGAALTLGKVLSGVNKAVGKGGLDSETNLYVSTQTWPNLADTFSASRQLDSSYDAKEGKNGVEKLTYVGSNGIIRVIQHPMVKGGEAFAVPPECLKKVGSTDITGAIPSKGDEIFTLLPANNGFEFRTYSDIAMFCTELAKCVKYTGIVNS